MRTRHAVTTDEKHQVGEAMLDHFSISRRGYDTDSKQNGVGNDDEKRLELPNADVQGNESELVSTGEKYTRHAPDPDLHRWCNCEKAREGFIYPPCRVGPTSVVRVGGGAALSYSRGRDHVHVGDKMARSLVSVDKASFATAARQCYTRASRQATQE